MSFKKIAIANRGEVAVRIITACKELGIQTALLHSEVDVDTKAYRMADERVCIGPGPSIESYLNIQNNIDGALSVGADAIHPGFGFLSENSEFSKACEKAKMVFIGPSPKVIALMGNKVEARKVAKQVGLPVLEGFDSTEFEACSEHAESIGYPIILKATGGGGGRGLKIVNSAKEFRNQWDSAQRESQSSFGSSEIFLEKYLANAKHIEIQILGDSKGHVVSVGERECSVQRRHQKIIEEAPCLSLDGAVKEAMYEASRELASSIGYVGAGTVEFLYEDGKFYFLEMNTRLQVEHPVTELVYGMDLVKEQIRIAEGDPLSVTQSEIVPRGHALECRLYAEDAYSGGLPSTGVLGSVLWPVGPHRRFDFGFETGDEIKPLYDPMIAKIITWDTSRAGNLRKMQDVLSNVIVFGAQTNIPLLKEIIRHSDFSKGVMTTGFMKKYFSEGLKQPSPPEEVLKLKDKLLRKNLETSVDKISPWTASWGKG